MVQSVPVTTIFKRIFPYLRRLILLLALAAVVLFGMGSSSVAPALEPADKARVYTRGFEFDYVGWMLDAMRIKFLDFSLGASNFMDADSRRELVLGYLEVVGAIQQLEGQIRMVYADPHVSDPLEASAELRRNLDTLVEARVKVGPMAEAILQGQINTVVNDLGLDLGGQAIPPVMYHSTPLPLALIISPRDVIRQDADISLLPDLLLDQQIALEDRVDGSLDVSSLVVNIGGVGVYPTMVMQTSDINWLSEVVAHEWVHNYLMTRPLGVSYLKSPELRTINETVANIAGQEIGLEVLEQYYPELVPPPPAPAPPEDAAGTPPPEPPAFSFNKTMHTTRVTVDDLLAQGKIEEAEAYMEAQRAIFWEQGYRGLRKLNQAYFAFHGAYADSPVGAAGADPVGAAVRKLRADSPTLTDFLRRVAWINDYADLEQMVAPPN